eukprot:m.233134 g.233134  ORF g.233134 m.233134 type:complete len:1196 (+) comp18997_c0_seq1:31-3618(+)
MAAAALHLYNFSLQKATQITHAVHGNFKGTKVQLIAVAKGKILELLEPNPATGKLTTLLSLEVFGVIRSMMPFRLTGGVKDYLVVGSDSGRIVVLEYNTDKNVFDRVHMETFGKSGCRRIVPGQYLAADPKGRAIMIAAIEKQKLVYIMNRDSAARLTISSPLEAHKAFTIVTHCTGLDVGFENPLFACLESNYEECDQDPTGEARRQLQQTLTFYELDLGLNHVVRKQSIPLEKPANLLIPLPGPNDGPGGVLVCGEDEITWRTAGKSTPVTIRIPRRKTVLESDRGTLIVNYAMHKAKTVFFYLLQTEQGDLFKLNIAAAEGVVTDLHLKYFDTVPVANALCLLRNGHLFVASEFANHAYYLIAQLGDNDDEPTFTSASTPQELYFQPRDLLNLSLLDDLSSFSPILDCKIADLFSEETPQFYIAVGRGPRSSLRTLRHGLEVTRMALSDLPGTPNAVWTVKRHATDTHDSYIVVSFVNATLVLSIGDTVQEVTDSGFLPTVSTLCVGRVGESSLVQVFPEGIRHIRGDKRTSEWKVPSKRIITHAAMNDQQVAISLSGGEIVYFEMNRMGELQEYSERMELQAEVMCLAIAPVQPGALRARFLAVGLQDATVRLVSLDPNDCLQLLSTQALPSRPESLVLTEMGDASDQHAPMCVFVGVDTGVMLRSIVDSVTGDLSDTRTRYLGVRGVRLFRLRVAGQSAVLALSTRPWLSYVHQGQMRVTPLSYEALDYASMFSNAECPAGIVAIAKHTMHIVSIDRLGQVFNQAITPLPYTPRKTVLDHKSNLLYLIEGDHNTLSPAVLAAARAASEGMDMDEPAPAKVFGEPREGAQRWASNIRIVDPVANETVFLLPLDPNEIATSLALVHFTQPGGDTAPYLVVGSIRDFDLATNNFSAAFINTYQLVGEDRKPSLQLLHKTGVEFPPSALLGIHGRLVAGVGRLLRLYELGQRKLLRKCENKHLPSHVVSLAAVGTRIAVCDMRESVVFVKYKPALNQLSIFADDTSPRWCTAVSWMDYSTVAVADKFGNISILRLPADIADDVDDDPHIIRALWDRGLLNGASQKAESIASFHIGETILTLQKVSLSPGGAECLVYSTLAGALGCLVPFTSKEDVDFFQHLEMSLRNEAPPLLGRDHIAFRSAYMPCKGVVDGDLCEGFNALDSVRKRTIAEELRRSPGEVSKKLEDIRNRFAF